MIELWMAHVRDPVLCEHITLVATTPEELDKSVKGLPPLDGDVFYERTFVSKVVIPDEVLQACVIEADKTTATLDEPLPGSMEYLRRETIRDTRKHIEDAWGANNPDSK